MDEQTGEEKAAKVVEFMWASEAPAWLGIYEGESEE